MNDLQVHTNNGNSHLYKTHYVTNMYTSSE